MLFALIHWKITILITQTGKFCSVLSSPAIMSCNHSYHQLLSMEGYVARNLHSGLNEGRVSSPSHWDFSSMSQKSQSKWLNFLGRWPTVVLLLSMLHITTVTANLSVDQGHSWAGNDLFDGGGKDCKWKHPWWESPQCEPGKNCVFQGVDIIYVAFFSSCSTAFDLCKTALICSNAKGNDF